MNILKFKQFVNESLNERMSPLDFHKKYPSSDTFSDIDDDMYPDVIDAIDDFKGQGYVWYSDGEDAETDTRSITKDLKKNGINFFTF